jgi:hypothetical protein
MKMIKCSQSKKNIFYCILVSVFVIFSGSISQTFSQFKINSGKNIAKLSATGSVSLSGNAKSSFFIENKGQWDKNVKYLSQKNGMNTWITDKGIVYDFYKIEDGIEQNKINNKNDLSILSRDKLNEERLKNRRRKGQVIDMQFVESGSFNQAFTTLDKKSGIYNYFIGNDKSKWFNKVSLFGTVYREGLYDGIDMRMYYDEGNIRYDFIVQPGADPNKIKIQFNGHEGLEINEQGDLLLKTSVGEVSQGKIFAYQTRESMNLKKTSSDNILSSGNYSKVECSFKKNNDNTISFELKDYDKSKPLIIDPLIYSTFLGGTGEDPCAGMALDGSGSIYVTGQTGSVLFPTTLGAYMTMKGDINTVYVSKINSDGSNLVYSTFLSGNQYESSTGIAVDGSGNACVTGYTTSPLFPVTFGAFQTSYKGDNEVFVTELNPDGSDLIYSTFLGGIGNDLAQGIAVDGSGYIYVTGYTGSTNYPITSGAYGGNTDAFVTKLNPIGSGSSDLLYSIYLGGSDGDYGSGITVDAGGNAYVTGMTNSMDFPTTMLAVYPSPFGVQDVFITKLNPNGTTLLYSTYLGGSGYDESSKITIDASGNAYVTGFTSSTDFQTTPGAYQTLKGGSGRDAFVSKLSADGSSLGFSTYLGGSGEEMPRSILVDGGGYVYVAGYTSSPNFPATSNAYYTSLIGGYDIFITELVPTGGSLAYSSYFGGTSDDYCNGLAMDGSGNYYIAGSTTSTNFPVTAGVYQSSSAGGNETYITKFSITGAVAPPGVPVLVSPTPDQITNINLKPTLKWSPGAGGAPSSYEIKWWVSSSAEPAAANQTVTDTQYTLTTAQSLLPMTKYSWSVRAINVSGTSSYSTPLTFITDIPAPALVSLNGKTNNSTGIPLSGFSITWNPGSPSTPSPESYDLEIATSATFGTSVIYTGSNVSSPLTFSSTVLTNGTTYYWRVRAKKTSLPAETSPWSEIWNFTTILGIVNLIDPLNNKTVSPIPTLSWNALAGAAKYNIEIHSNSSFTDYITGATNLTSTSWIPGVALSDGQKYYWRVLGKDNADIAGGWSNPTSEPSFTVNINIPVLSSPANNAVDVSLNPALSWNSITGAVSYSIQYGTDPAFNTNTQTQSSTTNSLNLSGLTIGTKYYWRVRAEFGLYNSEWSNSNNFTTIAGVITLIDPVNNKIVSTTPVLSWNPLSGSSQYTVQVFSNPTMDALVLQANNITLTSYTVTTPLTSGTRYYWRVCGYISGSQTDWSVHTDPSFTPNAEVPVLSSPANTATNISLSPTLAWSGTGATSYDVQFGTDPSFLTNTQTQTTSTNSFVISGLNSGTVYYWRVRSIILGIPGQWSGSFSFTTIINEVTLIDPVNDKSVSSTPTLTWNQISGISSYDVEVYRGSIGGTYVTGVTGVSTTSWVVNTALANGVKYYWRVRGKSSAVTGLWSSHADPSFTTASDITTLLLPANGASNIPSNIELSWSNSGAVSYTVQYGTDPSFMIKTEINGITDTKYTISSLQKSTVYYWRIIAHYPVKNTTSGSNSFTTELDVVNIIDPVDNKTVSTTPTLTWNPLTGATGYEVEIYSDYIGGTLVLSQDGITTPSWVVNPALDNGIKYYWRVRAKNNGATGGWSSGIIPEPSFSTSSNIPSLLTPNNYAINIPTRITLTWSNTGASSYTLQYSTDPNFSTYIEIPNIFSIFGIDPSRMIGGLSRSTIYYWRIKAVYPSGESDWSGSYSFTTIIDAVTLVDPLNNKNVSLNPTLTWNPLTGAVKYNVEIHTTSSFTGYVTGGNNLTSTSYVVNTGLLNGNTYYWRVQGIDANGNSGSWSTHSNPSFTTSSDIPSLLSPANYEINISQNPVLTWSNTGALSYTLQYDTDPSFATKIEVTGITAATGVNPSRALAGLNKSTVYYWKVMAIYSSTSSGWSSINSFTTSIDAVTLLDPLNGKTVSLNPTLVWEPLVGTAKYNLEIHSNSTYRSCFKY